MLFLVLSCAPDEPDAHPSFVDQDIRSTDLTLDLDALTGVAEIEVVPATDSPVRLEVGGLSLGEVRVGDTIVEPTLFEGIASVPVEGDDVVTVTVSYTFPERTTAQFDGWMPELGTTFVWPENCGNLFPCHAAPTDGVTFTMHVTGGEGDLVYPETTVSDGPPYMAAVAVGSYESLDLGTTPAGTHLSAWYWPGREEDAASGTAHLLDSFAFFESTYGPYAFGDDVRTVEVDWGKDSWGGMEHHPYFHVAAFDFRNEEPQIHEAAHGWFGDAVRLQCWEDFVLSEGTVTYITARASEQVGGDDFWPYYVDDFLVNICEGRDVNGVILPDQTCNTIDFEESAVWSLATYMKGACFYEDVADEVGAEVVDAAIAEYYQAHVNEAGRMQDMIDTLIAHAPDHADAIETFAEEWLRTEACPADYRTRCRAHE